MSWNSSSRETLDIGFSKDDLREHGPHLLQLILSRAFANSMAMKIQAKNKDLKICIVTGKQGNHIPLCHIPRWDLEGGQPLWTPEELGRGPVDQHWLCWFLQFIYHSHHPILPIRNQFLTWPKWLLLVLLYLQSQPAILTLRESRTIVICLANGPVNSTSLHCKLREQIYPACHCQVRLSVTPLFIWKCTIHFGLQDIFIGKRSAA